MLLYSILIHLYGLSIKIYSLFNAKAKLWIDGRKNFFTQHEHKAQNLKGCIWVHCASLGEFEQGRPLIEMIKKHHPEQKIVLTFFSPSGFEIRKNYPFADLVTYLPLDTIKNAKMMIQIFDPSKVIFIKYEFWHNLISELHKRKIKIYLVSGIFRKNQYFFQWYGKTFRKTLEKFDHIFVQDKSSFELLKKSDFQHITLSGDTRIDRTIQIASEKFHDPAIEDFIKNQKAIICGSTWTKDEIIISKTVQLLPEEKFIIVPHVVSNEHILKLKKLFPESILHSNYTSQNYTTSQVLIVDSIGILSKLYRYGWIGYVGGGFNRGIHNILEPAAYGIPVIFGPKHQKFNEAKMMLYEKTGFTIKNEKELYLLIQNFQNNKSQLADIQSKINSYLKNNNNATQLVYNSIFFQSIKKNDHE